MTAGRLRTHRGLSERFCSLKFGVRGHLDPENRPAYLCSYLAVSNSVCGEENETAIKKRSLAPHIVLEEIERVVLHGEVEGLVAVPEPHKLAVVADAHCVRRVVGRHPT